MLFLLYESLREQVSALNVLRYVPFRVIAAMVTSLLITWMLYPWLIRSLRVKQIGETIRTDGPAGHKVKGGTPTMGGALMVAAIFVSVALWGDVQSPYVGLTCITMLAFAVIGFIDDRMKLMRKKGMRGKVKLLCQFAVALAVAALFIHVVAPVFGYSTRLYFPFLRIDRYWLDLDPWLYAVFAAVVIVGTSNALNLSDGLDGLAILPTISGSAVYLLLAYLSGATLGGFSLSRYLLIPSVPGIGEMSVVASAVIGAGLGFLWYNSYPASVFMGDVGSLSLGAVLGCLSVFTKNELLSVVILGIFVVEAVSVITQTVSFKLTGRRVFRMAPLHHHYELQGVPEPKIIVRFWIISMLLGLVALASVKVR
jgi:phospho-N-acetylmuramoyl-pentapeptide-transferase